MTSFDPPESFVSEGDSFYPERVELVNLLLTKVPTRHGFRLEKIEYELYEVWNDICERHWRDREFRYIYANMDDAIANQWPWEDTIEEIRAARSNAEQWLGQALEEYNDLIAPLQYKVAGPGDYDKHYPNPNWSETRMLSTSVKKGILSHAMTPEVQEKIYAQACIQLWLAMLCNPDGDILVRTNTLTGYNEGKACTVLLFKTERTSRLAHAYPVTDAEAATKTIRGLSLAHIYKDPEEINGVDQLVYSATNEMFLDCSSF